mmetsp:Transcript_12255/g.27795  ORF Transcript_12255/g.27795 Transcript_12255/m.27795 type:complete len:960 (-) Transcript_12255:189-3068(-)
MEADAEHSPHSLLPIGDVCAENTTLFPLFPSEEDWNDGPRALLYIVLMVYIFLGVNVAADRFVAAIESITSRKKRVRLKSSGRMVTVLVWNGTVANLTLMALGSSAPEILLSAVEIIAKNFESGELGPGTIVGSAAFNLFVIIAVCIVAIPSPQVRYIKETNVFFVTAAFSLFAYTWLVIIVQGPWSKEVVDVWEAVATLLFLPVLVYISYGADVGWFSNGSQPKAEQHFVAADYGDGLWEQPRPGSEFKDFQHTDFQHPGALPHPSTSPVPPPQVPIGHHAMRAPGEATMGPGPGILAFEIDAVEVMSSNTAKTYNVRVCRNGGTEGQVGCKYRMERLSAVPGYDYVEEEGALEFAHGTSEAHVPVTILPKRLGDHKDTFQLILEDPEGGAVFNPNDDGGADTGVLTVTILNHNENIMQGSCLMRLMSFIDRVANLDEIRLGNATWWNELKDAVFKVGDDDDDEEPDPPTAVDYIMHALCMPWKVIVTLAVPPPVYCGGWICFVTALAAIGGLTVLIMDCATLFGCLAGISDQITAITLVALGTSMPDLFASRTAAVQDKHADASIVNVTGSNSVNVFMGIGLPWTMASIYHFANGTTFEVKGGADLVFSVIAFTIAAMVALCLIRFRRIKLGGELGGPAGLKIFSGIVLVMLWLFYIVASIWKIQATESSDDGETSFADQAMILFYCLFALENIIVLAALVVYLVTKDSGKPGKTAGDVEDAFGSDSQDVVGTPIPSLPGLQKPQPPHLVNGSGRALAVAPLQSAPWDKLGMQPSIYGAPASASGLRQGANANLVPHVAMQGRQVARRVASFTSIAMASIALARMRRGQRRRERLQWMTWMRQQEEAHRMHSPSSFTDVAVPVLAAVRLRRRALRTRLRRAKKNDVEEEAFLSPQASFRSAGEQPPVDTYRAPGDQPPNSARGSNEAMSSRVGNFIVNHAQDWAAIGVAGYMATRMV